MKTIVGYLIVGAVWSAAFLVARSTLGFEAAVLIGIAFVIARPRGRS